MNPQELPNMVVCERFRSTHHERMCAHLYHKGAYYRKCKTQRTTATRLYKFFNGAGTCNITCAECPIGARLAEQYPKMLEQKIRTREPLLPTPDPIANIPQEWKEEQRSKYKALAQIFFRKEAKL